MINGALIKGYNMRPLFIRNSNTAICRHMCGCLRGTHQCRTWTISSLDETVVAVTSADSIDTVWIGNADVLILALNNIVTKAVGLEETNIAVNNETAWNVLAGWVLRNVGWIGTLEGVNIISAWAIVTAWWRCTLISVSTTGHGITYEAVHAWAAVRIVWVGAVCIGTTGTLRCTFVNIMSTRNYQGYCLI